MQRTITDTFLIIAMCLLALVAIGYLIRTIVGPAFSDRILAVNSIQTIVIVIICTLAVLQGENYIVDMALIYAMLGFVTVVTGPARLILEATTRTERMTLPT